MIIDTPTGRIIPIFNCAGLQVDAIYEDQFVLASEHITLHTTMLGVYSFDPKDPSMDRPAALFTGV